MTFTTAVVPRPPADVVIRRTLAISLGLTLEQTLAAAIIRIAWFAAAERTE